MVFDFLLIVSFVITLLAQLYISINYSKYKKISSKKGIKGSYAAREVLDKNGLSNIYVVETGGNLTDHYDSSNNVIRLSSEIYNGDSLASLAVSLHEVGHAIQYKEKNLFMRFRSFIYPLVNISSRFSYIVILLGVILGSLKLFYTGVILFSMILLFQLVTLPVEFDASRKAIKILIKEGYLDDSEINGAKKVLFAAALTYVASLITTILQLLRILSMDDRR